MVNSELDRSIEKDSGGNSEPTAPLAPPFFPNGLWGRLLIFALALIFVAEIISIMKYDIGEVFPAIGMVVGGLVGLSIWMILVTVVIGVFMSTGKQFFSSRVGIAVSGYIQKISVSMKEVSSIALDSMAKVIGWIIGIALIVGFCYFLFSIPVWAAVIIVLLVLILAKLR